MVGRYELAWITVHFAKVEHIRKNGLFLLGCNNDGLYRKSYAGTLLADQSYENEKVKIQIQEKTKGNRWSVV